jgi:hypothetical protein
MERSMESREGMRERIVPENERAMRLFPGDAQFSTDACPRCSGLLVNEWSYDLCNGGEYKANLLRCVQCGYRIDPVILLNRHRAAIENVDRKDAWYMLPINTEMSGAAV